MYVPAAFGFWLGIKRRGNPYGVYTLTGGLVGLVTLSGILVELSLAKEGFLPADLQWAYVIPAYFVGPTLLFGAGTLFGNVVKRRAWPETFAESTSEQDRRQSSARLSDRATLILAAIITGVAQVAAAYIGSSGP
jgi:hypothetical protein